MLFLLFCVGLISGSINVLAGGGSLIALPLLIFTGMPPVIANATNRVAIVMQNLCGISGFYQQGVTTFKFSLPLAISATLGAFFGARIAVDLTDEIFKIVLASVMFGVILTSIWNPSKNIGNEPARDSGFYWVLSTILFFFVGLYGGFIQAGVGFLSLSVTSVVNRFDLVYANCIKLTVALFYGLTSVVVFASHDMIWWAEGVSLGSGAAVGAFFSSRYSVLKGHTWIQRIVLISATAMAIRLLLY